MLTANRTYLSKGSIVQLAYCKMAFLIRVMLIIVYLHLGGVAAFAGVTQYQRPLYKSDVIVNKILVVHDPSIIAERSNPSVYGVKRNAIVKLIYERERSDVPSTASWSYTVQCELTYINRPLPPFTQTCTLTIAFGDATLGDKPEDWKVFEDIQSAEVSLKV